MWTKRWLTGVLRERRLARCAGHRLRGTGSRRRDAQKASASRSPTIGWKTALRRRWWASSPRPTRSAGGRAWTRPLPARGGFLPRRGGDRREMRVPHCFSAAIDVESGAFALVLEDLSPARGGFYGFAGCSVEDAERAMVQAAALRKRWNDPRSPPATASSAARMRRR
ncbi:hypothetical protein AB5I41_07930 [Sphingomonas sp. MMS24-JH45]